LTKKEGFFIVGSKFLFQIQEGAMKEHREELKKEKRAYEKPAVERCGRLTDMMAAGSPGAKCNINK